MASCSIKHIVINIVWNRDLRLVLSLSMQWVQVSLVISTCVIYSLCITSDQSETQRHGVEELKSLKQVRVSDDICLIIYHLSSCISCLAVPFIFLWFFPMFLIFCHFSIFISMAIISAKH